MDLLYLFSAIIPDKNVLLEQQKWIYTHYVWCGLDGDVVTLLQKSETWWSVICQGNFLLTVLHVNIPWLVYNNTSIKRMLCGRVYLKWILIIEEFDDLSCVISVGLQSLCWSLVLKSTDVNLGSASLISAHAQWTFRMDHSIIHSILISTAALIHRTGTSIYTLIYGIVTLIYTSHDQLPGLALSSLYL